MDKLILMMQKKYFIVSFPSHTTSLIDARKHETTSEYNRSIAISLTVKSSTFNIFDNHGYF